MVNRKMKKKILTELPNILGFTTFKMVIFYILLASPVSQLGVNRERTVIVPIYTLYILYFIYAVAHTCDIWAEACYLSESRRFSAFAGVTEYIPRILKQFQRSIQNLHFFQSSRQ
jgi:hypothetical protein